MYGNTEWSIWEGIKEKETASFRQGMKNADSKRQQAAQYVKWKTCRATGRKVTCHVSPSVEETMHPIFV